VLRGQNRVYHKDVVCDSNWCAVRKYSAFMVYPRKLVEIWIKSIDSGQIEEAKWPLVCFVNVNDNGEGVSGFSWLK